MLQDAGPMGRRKREVARNVNLRELPLTTPEHAPMELDPAAIEMDRELFEIQGSYELLELLQPTNVDEAWERFRDGGFERTPEFDYPEITVDTSALRERLGGIRLDSVGDPSLLYFLSAKRDELELELRLIERRNTDTFLAASIQLYGPVQQELLSDAEALLETLDPDDGPDPGEMIETDEIERLTREELAHYRSVDSSFSAELRVRPEQEGFLATDGDLLFPESLRMPRRRALALMQHEIGVHIVTSHNGKKQPLRLLCSGLSSYDELQEAFGALAEHFADGFTAARLRTLAARALAARMTEQRLEFVDVFRRLVREHGFSESGAFRIAARVHQAGGFTRDQIYLRGLIYLLRYLRAGGALEPLYLGKLGHKEVPMIHDLRKRGVLREPPLRPRFLDMDGAEARMERLRNGLAPEGLVRSG